MKNLLLVLALFFSTIAYAQEIDCAKASASVSLKYDTDMNPIITGSIFNGSGCVYDFEKTIYKGNGKNITGVVINVNYTGNKGMQKIAQVNISPNNRGTFSMIFPKIVDGYRAYIYSVQGVRFSDGSYYQFKPPHNGGIN